MARDYYSGLGPGDITKSAAALPKRFNEVFSKNPDLKPDEAAAVVGDDGRSVLDIMATLTKILTETRWEISAAANRDNATLGVRAIDASVIAPVKASADRRTEREKLQEASDKLAEVMGVMSATDWGRKSQVESGETVSVEFVGQAIIRSAFGEVAKAAKLVESA